MPLVASRKNPSRDTAGFVLCYTTAIACASSSIPTVRYRRDIFFTLSQTAVFHFIFASCTAVSDHIVNTSFQNFFVNLLLNYKDLTNQPVNVFKQKCRPLFVFIGYRYRVKKDVEQSWRA